MERVVHVPLDDRAYDVVIGPGLVATAGARIAPLLRRKKVAVLTDETVAALHLETLRAGLAAEGIDMEAHQGLAAIHPRGGMASGTKSRAQ
jgi:3-dehydroquinate synthase